VWLSGQISWDSLFAVLSHGLEQVKAIEPNAGVCGPAMKARWLVIQRAERTFIGPLLGTNEAWYRPIFWHSTQELGLLPVSEEIVRAILLPQVGWRSSMSGSHGVPDGCLVLFDSRRLRKLYRSLSQHGSPLARESHYQKQGVVKRVLVADSPPTSKLASFVPDDTSAGRRPTLRHADGAGQQLNKLGTSCHIFLFSYLPSLTVHAGIN
jgi:hypothetical protein